MEKTSINGQTKTITTGTDEDGKTYVSNDGVTAKTTTDDFGRTTQVKTSRGEGNSVFFTDYEYANGKDTNSTTNLVSKLTQKYGSDEIVNYEYTYDKNGNITEIYENGTLAHKYIYDSLNQLYSEYDYVNRFYIVYSYGGSGNLWAKHEQRLDPTYGYPSGKDYGNVYYYNDTQWKDKLTGINGYDITYDESGNPLSYRDGITFTWQNGRQLASLQTADNSVSYKYDSNGMRTQKNVDGTKTYYYYDSNKNLIGLTKGNDTLLFYYDSDGNVTSFKYGDTMYYYVKNLQGDVVKIINQSGTEVAGYVYDAWGNTRSTTGDEAISSLNPFRYRSYVYDEESELYYLQSRYYDPFVGRFLNADAYCDTQSGSPLSTNMFAYCEDDPVNYVDDDGYARKKYDATKYKNTNWITKWASKYIPNLYTDDIKKKTIFSKTFLGVGIEISVGVAAQTNANGILGLLVSKKVKEISINLGFGGKTSFCCSAGLTWKNFYIKFGVAFSKKNTGLFYAVSLKISVSYLTAVAVAACCVAMPYLSTFMSSALSVVSASLSTVAKTLIPMTPKLLALII